MPIMKQSVDINASAEFVWECVTSVGTIHEKLLAFDDHSRSFTYEAVVRPPWLRRGVNSWRVDALSPERCRVVSEADIQVAPLAALRLLRNAPRFAAMSKTLDDLKVYAETGVISDRKRRAAEPESPPHPSRPGLFANAMFSTVTGSALLGDIGGLAATLALPEALTRGVGAALLGFAAVALIVARRARNIEILAVSMADLAWVAGSAGWLIVDPSRLLHVGGAALGVLTVASMQLWGLLEAARAGRTAG